MSLVHGPAASHSPAARAAVPLLRRLHVQAALAAVAVLVALAAGLTWVAQHQYREIGLEADQRLNLELARYIVAHQARPLVDDAGRVDRPAMEAMATQAMMINPAIEVYLLDDQGVVRAHALPGAGGVDPAGRRVDLAPVQALGAGTAALLPVLGDDPRVPGRRTVFSAAPLPTGASGRSPGWLYVVLRAAATEAAVARLARSRALVDTGWALGAATLLATAVMVLALGRLTRPLRELTGRVQGFRPGVGEPPARAGQGEIGLLADAIDAMQARIDQQVARLHEADRLRRELIGNISHDLRTPLANVQGYVETVLVRADRLDEAGRAEHLRTALRHADLLGRRIGDLFELSTLDAGRVTPRLEVFCLGELLQDVIHGYELDAGRRAVTLVLDEGSQLGARVHADIALIERVLQNLVDNALRHTPAGGAVTLSVVARGQDVEVAVNDTGCGIAQEHLPHIFERYWSAEAPAPGDARTPGSAGLGLAIVKRILDLHGSPVRVHSAPREGASFVFVLPRAG